MTVAPRHKPLSCASASRLIERLDRRPGAHARHLARIRRVTAAKWAAVCTIGAGASMAFGVTATAALPALGLLASVLAALSVLACYPQRMPVQLRELAEDQRVRWGLWVATACDAIEATGLKTVGLILLGVATGLGGATAVVWRRQVRAQWISARKATIGASAELSVARTLDASGVRVRHSVMLGVGGDADHVIVSSSGQLAAIETKTGGGRVHVDTDGRVIKSSGAITGDPIGQVLRQAAALSRLAGAPADAIVCVSGMTNQPFRCKQGVVFCSESDLPGVVRRLPPRLSPADAERAWTSLR